ncbi:hypothetical protein EET67_20655 [Pseudaminobacter arsenicus]|uniref:Uncharacterized protein n=1 Tax=Borborobacter arsenicus TaxID=1851146 RepID=A0A432V166_9HYPH|nr:hypothetical protein [Pseudaminobacter arsenicus]RUM95933.1 hypothetical protein EET67_20655 [Pseudaminobacter arsenicus]
MNIITTNAFPDQTAAATAEIVEMDGDMRTAAEGVVIELMVPELQTAGVDLTDMDAVRETLAERRFGRRLIINCAERAAAKALELRHAPDARD